MKIRYKRHLIYPNGFANRLLKPYPDISDEKVINPIFYKLSRQGCLRKTKDFRERQFDRQKTTIIYDKLYDDPKEVIFQK